MIGGSPVLGNHQARVHACTKSSRQLSSLFLYFGKIPRGAMVAQIPDLPALLSLAPGTFVDSSALATSHLDNLDILLPSSLFSGLLHLRKLRALFVSLDFFCRMEFRANRVLLIWPPLLGL